MRPKTTGIKLPPRMIARRRVRQSGKVWIGYFYNGRDAEGGRLEIPLGTDLAAAKRKWAELEGSQAPEDASLMKYAFDQYARDILPNLGIRTQKEYGKCLKQLRAAFDPAPINALSSGAVARYRDARSAKVRANREIAVLSIVFNFAREWGFTSNENPCTGIRKNKEAPRTYYAEADVWDAVYAESCVELQDAMDLNYLTGQRPADVLKMREDDIRNNELTVVQNKRGKILRIRLMDGGALTQFGLCIARLKSRPVRSMSGELICTPDGRPMSAKMLRDRFEDARRVAAEKAEKAGKHDLSKRVRAFQFRDIRPKAASEIDNLQDASSLLGHTNIAITKRVYRRTGEVVKPTK